MYVNIKISFFYSFFIHFIAVSLFISVSRPDAEIPIKYVDYWVVDIVAVGNAKSHESSGETSQEVQMLDVVPPSSDPSQEAKNILKTMGDETQVQRWQYRFMMNINDQMTGIKMRYFYKNVRNSVEGLLYATIPEKIIEALNGKSASVEISYYEDGRIENVSVSSDSDNEFADILKHKIQWDSVPSPARYALLNKGMKLRIYVNSRGKVNVDLELL
ncbi:MAG: hypothetical protein AB1348_00805 [Nitrospirota bacterium]